MVFGCPGGVFEEFPAHFGLEIRDFHSPALPRTITEVPQERLLAGTDWTTRVGPPFQSYGTMFNVAEADNPFPPKWPRSLIFLRQAGASEDTIEHIAGRNAAALYRLSL